MLISRSKFFKHHAKYIQYMHLDSIIKNNGSCSGLSCSKCIFGSDETKHLKCLLDGLNYVKRKKIAKSYFTELFLNADIKALKKEALKEFKLSNKETIDLIMKRREEIPKEINLGANELKYCKSKEARQKLIDEYGWVIEGDKLDCQD